MDVPCTLMDLEQLLDKYYPKLRGVNTLIYDCVLKQGRASRDDIAKYLDMAISPYLISRIEDLVAQNILIRSGNKPIFYDLMFRPME